MSFFVLLLLTFTLFTIIPFFSIFIQTIKNLIFFIFLVIVISANLMIHLNIEFFPLFFVLVYVGAIIVSVLFMVLTFDLRSEYTKKIFSNSALLNCFLYFFFSPALIFVIKASKNYLWANGTPVELDRIALYHECMSAPFLSSKFCDLNFGKIHSDNGLYGALASSGNDVLLISNNLYTNYAILFIILGVFLTLSLFAALAIIKQNVFSDGGKKV